jgi:hypothetical protein
MCLRTHDGARAEPSDPRWARAETLCSGLKQSLVAGVLVGLLSLSVPVPSLGETVILTSGKHVEVKSYKVQGQLIVLELQNGLAQAYALRDVNLTATQAANTQTAAPGGTTAGDSSSGAQQSSASAGALAPARGARYVSS